MADGSRPSDRRTELEKARLRISERIRRLEEAITDLENAKALRADAVARLASYRRSHARLQYERRTLEWEIQGSQSRYQSERTAPPIAEDIRKPPTTAPKPSITDPKAELDSRRSGDRGRQEPARPVPS